MSACGSKIAHATSADELNRTAVNDIGEWVLWEDFNIGFKTDRARFSVERNVIRVTLSGTFSDEREAAGQATDTEDMDVPLRLEYLTDASGLDRELGLTAADTSGIIELHCAREQQCIRLRTGAGLPRLENRRTE